MIKKLLEERLEETNQRLNYHKMEINRLRDNPRKRYLLNEHTTKQRIEQALLNAYTELYDVINPKKSKYDKWK